MESIFSYVFGDGEPNAGLDEEQLRYAAEVIRASGGAVAAEQLSIIFDPPSPEDDMNSYLVDEQWVLPALVKLGGRPEVTDDGDIVYVFDDMLSTASDTVAADWDQAELAPLME